MNKTELKIAGLLERISNLTANYENQIADLRVELTILSQEKAELLEKVDSLTNEGSENTE